MNKEALKQLTQELQNFATRMRDIREHCENEEQTKISMINPFIEILDYDVRDPRVVKLEYPVSIRGGNDRVDYALFQTNNRNQEQDPVLLIEAKSVAVNLDHERIMRQIANYADMASGVEYVALTNGIVWKWFRKEKNQYGDRKLSDVPFLVHDILNPLVNQVRFLHSIKGGSFDSQVAESRADEAHLSAVVIKWLEQSKEKIDQDLVSILLKKSGRRKTPRNVELLKEIWPDCLDLFIEKQARLMQVDELLQQTGASSSLSSDTTKESSDLSQAAEAEDDTNQESKSFDTQKGPVTLSSKSLRRAWKPVASVHWSIEKNAAELLVQVCKYLASLHQRGPGSLFDQCIAKSHHLTTDLSTKPRPHQWRELGFGYFVHTNLTNQNKKNLILSISAEVESPLKSDSDDQLVDLWLP